jgi:ligand-binding sensor domain-containing protein
MKTLLLSAVLFILSINSFPQDIIWNNYTTQNSQLPNDFIRSILVDDNNIKWIGTGNGLVKYNDEDWIVYDTSNSDLPSNLINCLSLDNYGKLWVGTPLGLASFDGNNWETFTPDNSGIPAENVTSLKTDSSGVWVGTMDHATYVNGGLGYYDGNTWTVYKKENSPLPDNRIMSLNISSSVLWIGTINGLARLQNGYWEVYQQDSIALNANDDIAAISFDSTRNIWLACRAMPQILASVIEGGLAKFDQSEWTIFTYHNTPLPQNANSINYIYVDRFNNIWSALWYQDEAIYSTWGIGLAKFDGTNEWQIYSNNYTTYIYCITMDNSNHLWIGTLYGLSEMIDPSITEIQTKNNFNKPDKYSLSQNYPNPFNPTTNIQFSIPHSGFVTLKVYDVLGNEIRTLVNEEKTAGTYNIEFDGSNLASGIYFYVLRAGDFVQSRKMLIVK